jgi:hypothetical protein
LSLVVVENFQLSICTSEKGDQKKEFSFLKKKKEFVRARVYYNGKNERTNTRVPSISEVRGVRVWAEADRVVVVFFVVVVGIDGT